MTHDVLTVVITDALVAVAFVLWMAVVHRRRLREHRAWMERYVRDEVRPELRRNVIAMIRESDKTLAERLARTYERLG